MTPTQEELLELYKLHTELADRVSQRREGANRLFVTLHTGLLAVIFAMVTAGGSTESDGIIFLTAGILGMALSISWYIIIRSYRQLNTGKFQALQELEKSLAYPFFTSEWKFLKEGKGFRPYWKLTVVETFLPCIFFGFSVFSLLLGVS